MAGRHSPQVVSRRTGAVFVVLAALVAATGLGACSSTPDRSVDGFCRAYVEVAKSGGALADPDDAAIATFRDQVAEIDRAASRAARQAPSDIAPTVDEVIEPLHELRTALGKAKDRAEVTAALRAYRESTDGLTAHQETLDTWTGANCGVVSATTTTTPLTIAPGITS